MRQVVRWAIIYEINTELPIKCWRGPPSSRELFSQGWSNVITIFIQLKRPMEGRNAADLLFQITSVRWAIWHWSRTHMCGRTIRPRKRPKTHLKIVKPVQKKEYMWQTLNPIQNRIKSCCKMIVVRHKGWALMNTTFSSGTKIFNWGVRAQQAVTSHIGSTGTLCRGIRGAEVSADECALGVVHSSPRLKSRFYYLWWSQNRSILQFKLVLRGEYL